MNKLNEKFNSYLASLAVMTFKLHNLHWNVVGEQFIPVHEYTEGLYDETFLYFDQIAEQFKMFGQMPDCLLSDYLKNSAVKEVEARRFTCAEALAIVLADVKTLREQATELRRLSDEADWFASVTLLEDQINSYNKRVWFLESTLG